MKAEISKNLSPIPILTYHQIGEDAPKGVPYRSLRVSPGDFDNQMSFLHGMGYKGLSMTGLIPYLRGEKKGKVVGITFDDGYLNNLEHAAVILDRYNFSATCYIVSSLAGHTNLWDEAIGVPQVPLMTDSQMREWISMGQEIGAHTQTHPHLLSVSTEVAYGEITRSKLDLESRMGVSIQHFCYPYGEFSDAHKQMVKEAGYLSATSTIRSRCLNGADFMALPRVPIVRSNTRLHIWMKVATAYEDRKSR